MSKKVEVIKASSNRIDRRNAKQIERLRVAAYCRVSTDSEEQLTSYNSQVEHYKQLIDNNPEWELVEIFADEGISGTQTTNRDAFQKMINYAMDNKIDLIVTKSISRFTRNTLDALKYVRLLRDKNVGILFEKENIDTLTMNGEMLLTILSSLAQQESESMSGNIKMGLKMKMKRGELVGFQGCLGYDYDPSDKSISINEEEAKIIRYIFERYTEGMGCFVIAKELTRLGYKTKKGNTTWNDGSVRRIVKNEKYKGDIRLGKTITVDPITHRRLDNMGEEEQYYLANNHEPIISDEMFDEAQKILNRRSVKNSNHGKRQKYTRKYAFSSLIKCGFCEANLTRRSWHGTTEYHKTVWGCVTANKKGKRYCSESKNVHEGEIEDAFVDAFNILIMNHEELVDGFLESVVKTITNTDNGKKLAKLRKEIAEYENRLSKLVDLNINGVINADTYESKYLELSAEIEKVKSQKQSLEITLDEQRDMKARLNSFRKAFDTKEKLKEFDREVFETVVDEVVVGKMNEDGTSNPYAVTFVFKSGMRIDKDCHSKKQQGTQINNADNLCSYQSHDTC